VDVDARKNLKIMKNLDNAWNTQDEKDSAATTEKLHRGAA